jgi:hypothetical protein
MATGRSILDNPDRVEEILLGMRMVAFHRILPDCSLFNESAKLRAYEMATGEAVMALQAWLLDGHKTDICEKRKCVESPSSPWEFFKLLYAPNWFKNRFPVKLTKQEFVVTIHHHYLCPHVETGTPEQRHLHYRWMGMMSGQIKEGEA